MSTIIYMQNITYVCVDEIDKHNLTGRIYHKSLMEKKPFYGIEQIFLEMEAIFDATNLPEAAEKRRTFKKLPNTESIMSTDLSNEGEPVKKGEAATFIIYVQYRQNATWQGKLTWIEKNKTQSFRSDIEFINLISSAANIIIKERGV